MSNVDMVRARPPLPPVHSIRHPHPRPSHRSPAVSAQRAALQSLDDLIGKDSKRGPGGRRPATGVVRGGRPTGGGGRAPGGRAPGGSSRRSAAAPYTRPQARADESSHIANASVADVASSANPVLKVKSDSKPNTVAGAICNVVREAAGNTPPSVLATGPAAINQAIKAIAIARKCADATPPRPRRPPPPRPARRHSARHSLPEPPRGGTSTPSRAPAPGRRQSAPKVRATPAPIPTSSPPGTSSRRTPRSTSPSSRTLSRRAAQPPPSSSSPPSPAPPHPLGPSYALARLRQLASCSPSEAARVPDPPPFRRAQDIREGSNVMFELGKARPIKRQPTEDDLTCKDKTDAFKLAGAMAQRIREGEQARVGTPCEIIEWEAPPCVTTAHRATSQATTLIPRQVACTTKGPIPVLVAVKAIALAQTCARPR